MSLSNLLIIFSSSFYGFVSRGESFGKRFCGEWLFTDLDPKQRKTAIRKLILNFIIIGVGTFGHRPPVFVNVRTGHPCHSVGRWDTYL